MKRRSGSIRLNITMDASLYRRVKQEVPPKRVSAFISDAVRARLFPEKADLQRAYRAAAKEGWRRSLARDWEATDVEDWPA